MPRTLYEVMDLAPDAAPSAIRAAFRRQAMQLHPDRSRGSADAMIELNHAYEILKDPAQREQYDRTLLRSAPRASRLPSVDPLEFVLKVFRPVDARLLRAIATLRLALEELAYDIYDERYLERFESAVSKAAGDLDVAYQALRQPWPDALQRTLGVYSQGIRLVEDAVGDFEAFGQSFDVDVLAVARDILDQGAYLMGEARGALT